jgi:hypothetical protein
MKATFSSETSIVYQRTTPRHIPADGILQISITSRTFITALLTSFQETKFHDDITLYTKHYNEGLYKLFEYILSIIVSE